MTHDNGNGTFVGKVTEPAAFWRNVSIVLSHIAEQKYEHHVAGNEVNSRR